MSRSEIEKAAEMEKSKTVRILNSLIEKKILKKTGAGRDVYKRQDYIVSRNPKDFQNSKVPCIDPKELVVKEHI